MSYDFSTAPGISPGSQSRTNNGATLTALGATMTLGGATGANGAYGQFRFDTTALRDKDVLVDLRFKVVAATVGSSPRGFGLWAVDYGTLPTLTTADYGVAENNGAVREPYKGYAVYIGEIIPAGPIVAGTAYEMNVPPRFVNCEGLYSGFTDLEIRPNGTEGVPDAAHSIVLHGPSAASDTNKPALLGISMTENELLEEGNGYREDVDPSQVLIAVGLQPAAKAWVKPIHILPRTGGTLGSSADNLMSTQTQESRSTSAHLVPGAISAGGTVNMELTPEVWPILLRGMCKLHATQSLGGGRYKHTFRIPKVGSLGRFTVYQRDADWRHQIFPDVVLQALNLSFTPGGLIQLSASFPALFAAEYGEIDAGGPAADFIVSELMARDSNPPISFMGVEAQITTPTGMVITGEKMSRIGISLAQDVGGKPNFNRKRHAGGHTFGGVGAAFNFEMYNDSEAMVREHFGLDSATEYPFVCGDQVNFHSAELRAWGPEGDYLQGFVFKFPRFGSATLERETGSPIVSVQAAGLHSDSVDGSFEIEYYTTEDATFFEPSTDYLKILPAGYAYSSRVTA